MIGTQGLTYVKSASGLTGNSNNDYVELVGDVTFNFQTSKILAGRYTLRVAVQRGFSYLASIQALVDDKKVGVVLDPTLNSTQFATFTLGTVDFSDFDTHKVTLRTVIPGWLLIDRIIFVPIQ